MGFLSLSSLGGTYETISEGVGNPTLIIKICLHRGFTGGERCRLIEQRYRGIARYEKGTAMEEKGSYISHEVAPNVTVLLEK